MPTVETKLSCYDFGRQLLETNDLDPVYVLLHGAKDYFHSDDLLKPWLLAYWCFYHVGTASWILDQEEYNGLGYWEGMMTAAKSKDYPRSAERRHFRGQNAIKSVEYLEKRGLNGLFDSLILATRLNPQYTVSVGVVIQYVQRWVGFGPWISFKVADMLERLGLTNVDFNTDNEGAVFDSPREGAIRLWVQEVGSIPDGIATTKWAMDRIVEELGSYLAPPRYERTINYQEAETILCKWKSYLNGHYHVGEDIAACRKALLRFSRSRTAQRLLRAGKDAELWK